MSTKQIKCRPVRSVWSAVARNGVIAAALVASSALWSACAPNSSGELSQTPDANGVVWVEPAGDWKITPSDEFDSVAWHPVFTIHNRSQDLLLWEVRRSKSWLRFPETMHGDLAPGDSVQVPIDIDPDGVAEDGEQPAFARVTFVDRSTGVRFAQRSVTVENVLALENDEGWTSIDASADTRRVYVSASAGDDEASGLSPSAPKRTIAAGKALLRHGFPDWLLLQRGDTWHESLGQWKKSGRSAEEPMVVMSYGDAPARPLLKTGNGSGVWTNGGGQSPATIDHWAIIGLSFFADGYEGDGNCIGAQLLQPGTDVLIEDCKFKGYSTNLVLQGLGGRHSNIRLRRSVVVDAYSIHGSGNHPQGLYAYGVDGLLIEDNVFDHNGWNESVPGAGADIFSHNLYIDNGNSDVVVRGNIISNASSHGMQLRPGGTVLNNLFLRNSISLSVGGGNNPDEGGVTADVRGNVILEGKDIDHANPRGWGMWFANIKSGRVSHNVIANSAGRHAVALVLDGDHRGDARASIGIRELVVERNVLFNWNGGVRIEGGAEALRNVQLVDNDIDELTPGTVPEDGAHASVRLRENRIHARAQITGNDARRADRATAARGARDSLDYPDSARSNAFYAQALAGGDFESFLERTRAMSKGDWRAEFSAAAVNEYVRGGFRVLYE